MRFRKKNRYRPPAVHESLALESNGGEAVGEPEERAELSRDSRVRIRPTSEPATSDPGQDLLGALGDFQQQLSSGRVRGTHGAWRDETMAHLVSGYRRAKRQGWHELAQALADTGRILQSYVDGGRAKDSLPLLQSSYQTLCLIVGDQMAGQPGEAIAEQWQEHYRGALSSIQSAGLTLARDRDDDGGQEERPMAQQRGAAARTMQDDNELSVTDDWGDSEELPVLEELPPLEGLLETGIEEDSAKVDVEVHYAESDIAEDASAEPADDVSLGRNGENLAEWVEKGERKDNEPSGPSLERVSIIEDDSYADEDEPAEPVAEKSAPPKIVVDILDRLCDQLRSVERTTGEERTLHLERLSGAVSVLKREAEQHGYDTATDVCSVMEDSCVLALATDGKLNERFTELAYAFGGIFMEAQEDGETKAVVNWKLESALLVESWGTEPEEESEPEEELVEAIEEVEEAAAEEPEAAAEIDDSAQLVIEPAPPEAPKEVVVEVPAPVVAKQAPVEAPAAPTAVSKPELSDDNSSSHELLEYAQKAASAGDGTSAKFLALRAAAQFARDETQRAQGFLSTTESKLRRSMESTEAAREQVKSQEECVTLAATEVADGESTLGAMQERRGKVVQHLEEVKNSIVRVEEEIRALQLKLAAENEKAEQTKIHLEQAVELEQNAEAHLEQQRRNEEEARLNLEKCRQDVKDHQRSTLEIEAEMHAARDSLSQQRASLSDIEQTIAQISGNEQHNSERADAMLF